MKRSEHSGYGADPNRSYVIGSLTSQKNERTDRRNRVLLKPLSQMVVWRVNRGGGHTAVSTSFPPSNYGPWNDSIES